ncbi:MAG: hypothetical protein PHI63_01500 [Patescibacteria group bacterium]|nr:hypothetical protein [Patescibacteria group bacterium]
MKTPFADEGEKGTIMQENGITGVGPTPEKSSGIDLRLTPGYIVSGLAETFTWVLLAASIFVALAQGNYALALIAAAGVCAWARFLLRHCED